MFFNIINAKLLNGVEHVLEGHNGEEIDGAIFKAGARTTLGCHQ